MKVDHKHVTKGQKDLRNSVMKGIQKLGLLDKPPHSLGLICPLAALDWVTGILLFSRPGALRSGKLLEGWGIPGLFPGVTGTRKLSGSKAPQRVTGHVLKWTTREGVFGQSGQSGAVAFTWWRPWMLNVLQSTGQAQRGRNCLPPGWRSRSDAAHAVAAASVRRPF